MKRVKIKSIAFLRKPNTVDLALTCWWLCILISGCIGLAGFPSERIQIGVGTQVAQYVVSLALVIVATIGALSRFLQAHTAESSAAYGVAGFTLCHTILFTFFGGGVAGAAQTGMRLFAGVFVAVAVAELVKREYKITTLATLEDTNV